MATDTQAALRLRIDAIDACKRGEYIKSAQLYKQARIKLKLACAKGSPHAQYLLGTSYSTGGWGKLIQVTKYMIHVACCDDRIRELLRWYNRRYHRTLGNEIANACDEMDKGDFTAFEALFAVCGVDMCEHVEYIQALYDLGSAMVTVSQARLEPYLTSCAQLTLCKYATDPARILKTVHVLELSNNDTTIREFLGDLHGVILDRKALLLVPFVTYMMGRLNICPEAWSWEPVLQAHERGMQRGYRAHWSQYQKSTTAWLLCARTICSRDIAGMIGKLVFAGRYDKWLYE